MKKFILIITFLLVNINVIAQTEKGKWIISGSTTLSFNNNYNKATVDGKKITGPKFSTYTINPSLGYFVINNFALGLDLSYKHIRTKIDDEKILNNQFAFLPSATYYFTENNIKPYLGVGIGYTSVTEKYISDIENEKIKTDGFTWKVKGGVSYFFTSNISADLGLSFSQISNKINVYNNKVNNFDLGIGLSIYL